jgi:hypothetical protein
VLFCLIAKENILELVHACIGKHKSGVIFDDHWSGRNDMMIVFPEIIKEGLPDFF